MGHGTWCPGPLLFKYAELIDKYHKPQVVININYIVLCNSINSTKYQLTINIKLFLRLGKILILQ